jgi:uncharacterized protein YggU (UPF0235/DUF167 family)
VPRKSVELVSGASSRSKVFLLRGASAAEVRAKIEMQIAG